MRKKAVAAARVTLETNRGECHLLTLEEFIELSRLPLEPTPAPPDDLLE